MGTRIDGGTWFSLEGKVAIVTDCVGDVGASIARSLATAGADIVGVFFHTSPEAAVEGVRQAGRKFIGVRADLREPDSINEVLSRACGEFGRVDVVVHVTSPLGRERTLDYPVEEWLSSVTSNLTTAFFVTQACARQFIRQGTGGKVVHVISGGSSGSNRAHPVRETLMAGITGITRSLGSELAPKGVTVNFVEPGELTEKRGGKTPDVSGAVVFLCSPAADSIHGACLAVGRSA